MNDGSTTESVEISQKLTERIDSRLSHSDFDTVEDYVEFVLQETLTRVEKTTEVDGESLDRGEIESRLEALGYLD